MKTDIMQNKLKISMTWMITYKIKEINKMIDFKL